MEPISKSEFKAKVLEVLMGIEKSGEARVITDHGKPTLEIRKLSHEERPPLEVLRGTVLMFEEPIEPVAAEDWEIAQY